MLTLEEVIKSTKGIDITNRCSICSKENVQLIAWLEELLELKNKCNPHPKAPHGFNRNASHSSNEYVCECASWNAWEDGYNEGYRKGLVDNTD